MQSYSQFQLFDDETECTEEAQVSVTEEQFTVEELLISCVQARPPLWDSRLPIKERSKTIRDNLWLDIYAEFGSNPECSVNFLIKKWRHLRDTFVRIKEEYLPSGSACQKKKKWEYFDSMQFLCDTINYRPTVSNVVLPGCSKTSPQGVMSDESESLLSVAKPPQKKTDLAILEALERVNAPPIIAPTQEVSSVNPICKRISNMMEKMPERAKTVLEIKLLQTAFEAAKEYLD